MAPHELFLNPMLRQRVSGSRRHRCPCACPDVGPALAVGNNVSALRRLLMGCIQALRTRSARSTRVRSCLRPGSPSAMLLPRCVPTGTRQFDGSRTTCNKPAPELTP
eukprot:363670-Chlamydomonas_euryale.AAC.15